MTRKIKATSKAEPSEDSNPITTPLTVEPRPPPPPSALCDCIARRKASSRTVMLVDVDSTAAVVDVSSVRIAACARTSPAILLISIPRWAVVSLFLPFLSPLLLSRVAPAHAVLKDYGASGSASEVDMRVLLCDDGGLWGAEVRMGGRGRVGGSQVALAIAAGPSPSADVSRYLH